MEPAPIYQGQAFATPRVANTSSSMPTKPLFADLWEQNRHEATKALQGIEQALIDRNDNTILLSQQAEAKANDIALTTELKNRLALPNGAPNGFYDANGKIIPSAVRELVTRYRNLTHSWNKALIDPTNQQRSAESTTAYQQGITSATEAAILANMHEREAKAYEENIRYSVELGQYDNARRLTEEANANGAFSDPRAGMIIHDIEGEEIKQTIRSFRTPHDFVRAYDNPAFMERVSRHPEILAEVDRMIGAQELTGKRSSATTTRNADGSTSVTRTPATPPLNAPDYLQDHWMKWNGNFGTPDAKAESAAVMQLWLGESITKLKGSEEGDSQWFAGRVLANQLGISDAEYEQLYKTRSQQLSFGGFNAEAILNDMSAEAWLGVTPEDEAALFFRRNSSHQEREAVRQRIANAMRNDVNERYEAWWHQNKERNPSVRDQAAQLQSIINEVIADKPLFRVNGESLLREYERVITPTTQRSDEVTHEVDQTKARQRQTTVRTTARNMWRNIPQFVSKRMPLWFNIGNLGSFNFELGVGSAANNLPDTDTKNIIYLPEGSKLPAESMYVQMNNGRHTIPIEFRHANVDKPTMSVNLRLSTGTARRNPSSVRWDGVNLIFSEDNVVTQNESYEEAIQYSNAPNSLIPDEGLNPEDVEATEAWYNSLPVGELSF